MPEARQNSSKLPDIFESASSFSALVGTTVDVVSLFMALLSFVESAPRAYRLKASNAASPISTSIGTIPRRPRGGSRYRRRHARGRGCAGPLLQGGQGRPPPRADAGRVGRGAASVAASARRSGGRTGRARRRP